MKQKDTSQQYFASITGILAEISNQTDFGNDLLSQISNTQEIQNDANTKTFHQMLLHQSGLRLNSNRTNRILTSINEQMLSFMDFTMRESDRERMALNRQQYQITSEVEFRNIIGTNVVSIAKDVHQLLGILGEVYGYGGQQSGSSGKSSSANDNGDVNKFMQTMNIGINRVVNSIFGGLKEQIINLTQNLELMIEILQKISLSNENIVSEIAMIYAYLPRLMSGGTPMGNIAEGQANQFVLLAESLGEFDRALSPEFLARFKEFVDNYERFVSDQNAYKLTISKVNLLALTGILRITAEVVERARAAFGGLAKAIMLFSIVMILPPFQMGMWFLLTFLKGLKTALGGNKKAAFTLFAMSKLATGIGMLAASLWLMGKVKFDPIFKVLTLLTGLAIVVRLFNGKEDVSVSRNITTNRKFKISGIFGVAMGIAVLVLSLTLVKTIDFTQAGALLLFIGGLGTILYITGKKTGFKSSHAFEGIFTMSLGLSILVLAISAAGEISWGKTWKIIAFIGALGMTIALTNLLINKASGGRMRGVQMSGLFGFAAGLAILILSVDAVKELDWTHTAKLLLFIFALGVAIAAPGFLMKGNSKAPGGLVGFAFGMGLLVLSVYAMREIGWGSAFMMVGFIFVLGLSLKLFDKSAGIGFLLMAGGITMLSLSLKLMSTIDLTDKQIILFSVTVLAMVGISILIGKVIGDILLGAAGMALIGIAFLGISTSLLILSKANITWKTIGTTITFTLAMVAIVFGLSFIVAPIALGSLSLVLLGAGLLLYSISLRAISGVDIDWGNMMSLIGVTYVLGLLMIGVAALTPIFVLAGVALIIMGAGLLTMGFVFASVGLIDATKMWYFLEVLSQTVWEVAAMLPGLLIATISAALLIVVGISLIVAVAAFGAINEMDIKPERIDNFVNGLKYLMAGFDTFGIIQTGKAALKAAMLIPILTVSLLAALAFKGIQEMDISDDKMRAFGTTLGQFIDITTEEINRSQDALKRAEPGLEALMKLVNVGAGLVDLVVAFSNMTYNEYEVVDGQIRVKAVHKITADMLGGVGQGIGKLLIGLLQPLNIMASDAKVWDFGNGVKVNNPFAGGWFGTDSNSGVNRVKKIGEAFNPLIDVIKNLSQTEFTRGAGELLLFQMGVIGGTSAMVTALNMVGTIDKSKVITGIDAMIEYFETFEKINYKNVERLGDGATKLTDAMADEDKWRRISTNMRGANRDMGGMIQNINRLDIAKATALERNLKLMTETQSFNKLIDALEKLIILIGLLNDKTANEARNLSQQTVPNNYIMAPQMPLVNNQQQTNTPDPETIALQQQIKDLMETISAEMGGVNTKLGGVLKVKNVQNVNDIF